MAFGTILEMEKSVQEKKVNSCLAAQHNDGTLRFLFLHAF